MSEGILFLEALATIAGGQRVLLDMLPALNSYDLHALLPGPGPLGSALATGGVTCHFAPMASYTLVSKRERDVLKFPLDQLHLAFRCANLSRRLSIDLVYANSSRTFVWGTLGAAIAHLPVFWHAHNVLADPKTRLLVRCLGRWRTVRRVIAVSATAAAQFAAIEAKVVVVPTGVDVARFHPNPAARAAIRAEFNISSDEFVVGIVGDLLPLKGHHTLLEAARLGLPQVHYLVVGDARPKDPESLKYAAHLRQTAPDDVVTFTGRRQDLPAVLNAMDLLVIASEHETGPLVLLEGLACGVPVLSTPVGRAPELLPPDALFPINDSVGLSDRLRSWLADRPRLQEAGLAARSLAKDQLSLKRFRERMADEITL